MRELRKKLADAGLDTELVIVAKSGSCYLRFILGGMGKVRIADHRPNARGNEGIWQIRLDVDQIRAQDDTGRRQYTFPATELDSAVAHMVERANTIRRRLWRNHGSDYRDPARRRTR